MSGSSDILERMFENIAATMWGFSPAGLDGEALLAAVVATQRLINSLSAIQLRCVAGFANTRPAPAEPALPGGEQARWGDVSEFASAEIAVTLHSTRRAADRMLSTAYLLEQLPATRPQCSPLATSIYAALR